MYHGENAPPLMENPLDEIIQDVQSKDDPNSSANKRSGFSLPRTDTEHKLDVGVDQIQGLDDCPVEFKYGKDILPDWAIEGISSEM